MLTNGLTGTTEATATTATNIQILDRPAAQHHRPSALGDESSQHHNPPAKRWLVAD